MIDKRLEALSGKRVLLLQGPVGPFFARFAADLRAADAEVFKVNFNLGDWFFYRRGAFNYRGTMEDWPAWLEERLRSLRIDVVFMFGDCRPVHQAAHAVVARLGLELGVFEEGYVRPDHVTLERAGVNGYSRMPRTPEAYRQGAPASREVLPVGNAYWHMVHWGFWYFTVGGLGKPFFPHYVHHRPLTIVEALPWIRSVWRKQWYRWKESSRQDQLTSELSRRYFLAPLQVFNDAQVTVHAGLAGVEEFIEITIASFARRAPADTMLVFKHHPMDRGYRDYARRIRQLARERNIEARVLYIHDQHLPTLLDHARGVVLVNSTVGMSALHHGAPTIVLGRAIYDMPGLTYRGSLDDFWAAAPECKPDRALFERFRSRLIAETQINGSFYKPVPGAKTFSGLVFDPAAAAGSEPATGVRLSADPLAAPGTARRSAEAVTYDWARDASRQRPVVPVRLSPIAVQPSANVDPSEQRARA
jgi:capsular polysaccharide export protein